MCHDDPDAAPYVNDDDVSGSNALDKSIPGTNGANTLRITPKDLFMEDFSAAQWREVFGKMVAVWSAGPNPGDSIVPTSIDAAWREIGTTLQAAATAFEGKIKQLRDAPADGQVWKGEAIKAAYDNAASSIEEPRYIGSASLRGAELAHKFRDTLSYTIKKVVEDPHGELPSLVYRYNEDIKSKTTTTSYAAFSADANTTTTTPDQKEVEEQYNNYVRKVMTGNYVPGLTEVGRAYPQFTADATPAVNRTGPTPNVATPNTPSGPGGSPKTPSLNTDPSKFKNLNTNTTPQQTTLPNQNQNSNPAQALQSALSGANDALKSGSDAAKGLASQAADAVKGLADSTKGLLSNSPTLPEGTLGLGGPLGSTASKMSGLPRSTGGGGLGSGGNNPKPLASRTAMPAAAASTNSSATPATSRSGLSTSSGSGMGAGGGPAAGQRGGDGKEHKVNKALRTRANGSDIVGEADAVLPVIGEQSNLKPDTPPNA